MAQALEAAALRRHAEANALVKRRGSRKATRRLSLDALQDAAQLILKEDAKVAKSRLPLWAAVAYAFCTLGFIGMVFFTRCGTDRYPFGNWNDPCRPCTCDSAGLLVLCAVPAELKTGSLHFQKQKITAINPGAFRGNNYLTGGVSFLHANHALFDSKGYHDGHESLISIKKLPTGAFDGLENLRGYLELSSLNISAIEPGAFRAGRRVGSLSLRNNHLTTLPSGVFDGLRSLRLLFMDDNNMGYVTNDTFSSFATSKSSGCQGTI